MPNARAIAEEKAELTREMIKVRGHGRTRQHADSMVQLLKIVMMAAVYSPKANEFLQRMPSLSFDTQACIKSVIEEVTQLITRPPRPN